MANRIARDQIERMFAVYALRQCVDEVAKKFACSHRTVERYRRIEGWDEQVEKARALLREQRPYGLADAMAASVDLVRVLKEKYRAAVITKTVLDEDVTVSDLERLVKLEAFLLGGVESRHEVVAHFEGWSDEELREFSENGKRPTRASVRTA